MDKIVHEGYIPEDKEQQISKRKKIADFFFLI